MKRNFLIFCFYLLCLFLLPTSNSIGSSAFKKHRTDNIQLDVPTTWNVTQRADLITFKDKNGTEVLWVQLFHGTFDEAAEEAGFVRVENKWRLLGRHEMEGETEEISTENWRGLIGEAPVGVSGDFGFGLGSATVAMISNGKTAAILSGEAMRSEDSDRILKSLRFQKK
jgi:hypothetical protein